MDYPLNFNYFFGEIYDQAMFFSQCFKIRPHDSKMNIFNIFDGLQLNNDSIVHNKIESMSPNFNTIIVDNDLSLPLNFEILFLQLDHKSIFIDWL